MSKYERNIMMNGNCILDLSSFSFTVSSFVHHNDDVVKISDIIVENR